MVFTVGAILMEKMAGLLERSLVAGKCRRRTTRGADFETDR